MTEHGPCVEEPESLERHALRDLGFFGHYLHMHRGGRGGKQYVLKTLLNCGPTCTQREIQERSQITSASLSEVVAKLEGEGLIQRERSDQDRRQLTLTLTERGHEAAVAEVARRQEFEAQAFSCLTPEELEQFVSTLDRLAAHWQTIEQPPCGPCGPCGTAQPDASGKKGEA